MPQLQMQPLILHILHLLHPLHHSHTLYKDTAKVTLQNHQHRICSNSPIMPTTSSTTPISLPNDPWQILKLQHNIITQYDKDNPMAINIIQHQVWNNHLLHLHMTLSPQILTAIICWTLCKHLETGKTITSYEKLVKYLMRKETWSKAMVIELGNIA